MSVSVSVRDPKSPQAELGAGISRPLVLLLAFTCGAAVANLYYAQPLLHTIAHAFSVSSSSAGLLVTVTAASMLSDRMRDLLDPRGEYARL